MTPPVIKTERLRLRPWKEADFNAFRAFMADPEAQAFRSGPADAIGAWAQFCAKAGEWAVCGMGTLVINEADADRALGYAGLWSAPYLDEPELCWSLFADDGRGKGYATEAAAGMRDWAYAALGLPPLMSFVHPENHPSRAVAERLGARCLGDTTLRGQPRLFYRHVGPV